MTLRLVTRTRQRVDPTWYVISLSYGGDSSTIDSDLKLCIIVQNVIGVASIVDSQLLSTGK